MDDDDGTLLHLIGLLRVTYMGGAETASQPKPVLASRRSLITRARGKSGHLLKERAQTTHTSQDCGSKLSRSSARAFDFCLLELLYIACAKDTFYPFQFVSSPSHISLQLPSVDVSATNTMSLLSAAGLVAQEHLHQV